MQENRSRPRSTNKKGKMENGERKQHANATQAGLARSRRAVRKASIDFFLFMDSTKLEGFNLDTMTCGAGTPVPQEYIA